MFLYILNLLNDSLKKNNIYGLSAFEIINDTTYISELAGLKKNFDFKSFNDRIIDIFELLSKYNLTMNDSFEILNKLIINDNHSWILENIYNNLYVNKKKFSDFDLNLIINNSLLKTRIEEKCMKINHLALWVNNIELMKDYYVKFFDGKVGEKYTNKNKGFSSYFISFDSGARIEIMSKKDVNFKDREDFTKGYAHMAISVGSKEKVDLLTEEIRNAGYEVTSESRTTGDGYYESCVLDPEGNLIEITI